MTDQQKWNERYLSQDTPWDIGTYHPEMARLFSQYISKGKSVLEIGCGTGINAKWLDHAGYHVTAIDISEEAIQLANQPNSSIHYRCVDFLKNTDQLTQYSTIFDCAVLPVLNKEQRLIFVKKVAEHCEKDGYWINISCSKDHADEIENQTKVKSPPYLTAEKIITLAEPFFEIIEMKRCDFRLNRKESGEATFHAWGSIFRKRK